MHLKPLEELHCPRQRIPLATMIEVNPDLRRSHLLGRGDRLHQRGQVGVAHELPHPSWMRAHHQSPLAPPPPKLPPPPLKPPRSVPPPPPPPPPNPPNPPPSPASQ